MRTWEELWIKYWGRIPIDEIIPWDVIELDYQVWNRRYIVKKIEWDYIRIDDRDVISKNNPDIVWVIRWYPDDEEMKRLVLEKQFCVDVPDMARDSSPVFVSDMIERFKPDIPYRFNTIHASIVALDELWLNCSWYTFDKRWILWDSLKFYAIWEKVSYFI